MMDPSMDIASYFQLSANLFLRDLKNPDISSSRFGF
jgi:hypothetical protein